VIINFFAVPEQNQIPFRMYKLLGASFVYGNEVIQLTHIPRYWAINLVNNTTMEWYHSEESEYVLQFMPSCRDTPPLRKLSNNTCLGQIMGRHQLSRCLKTAIPLSVGFLRQLRDNIWISSSLEPLHCIRISKSDYLNDTEQTFNMSEHIKLPPFALINVTPGYVITCPGFILTGRPIISNVSLLLILHNNTIVTNNVSIVNVYRHIKENTVWFDRKSFKLGTDGFTPYVNTSTRDNDLQASYSICIRILLILIFVCMFFGVSSSMIHYICRRQQQYSLQHPSSFLSS
jgi:hypothetical protein